MQSSVPSTNFNWSSLDAEYKYCQDHNIVFKLHTVLWGAQMPSGNIQPSDVQNFMTAFCQRYPNTKIIDVVNEPLHNPFRSSGNIGGAGTSGWDWIVNALKWGRAACPNVALLVNDYNTVEITGDRDRFISLVNAVKTAGGPIDGIGAQAHGTASMASSDVQANIDTLASKTGLPVYITEFDLNIADDTQQATVMQRPHDDVLERHQREGHYRLGLPRRRNVGDELRAHAEQRYDASGHDVARKFPQRKDNLNSLLAPLAACGGALLLSLEKCLDDLEPGSVGLALGVRDGPLERKRKRCPRSARMAADSIGARQGPRYVAGQRDRLHLAVCRARAVLGWGYHEKLTANHWPIGIGGTGSRCVEKRHGIRSAKYSRASVFWQHVEGTMGTQAELSPPGAAPAACRAQASDSTCDPFGP